MNRKPVYQPETRTYRVLLTRGYEAVVDDVDAELAALTWTALPNSNTVYACRGIPLGDGKQTTAYLHRVILALKLGRDLREGEHVDHIDGNGLNNTRGNLRVCSNAQNRANSRKRVDNISGLKGVCWHKQRGKWHVQIGVNGKLIHIGYYTRKEAAYAAYCEAAARYHKEFANNG